MGGCECQGGRKGEVWKCIMIRGKARGREVRLSTQEAKNGKKGVCMGKREETMKL